MAPFGDRAGRAMPVVGTSFLGRHDERSDLAALLGQTRLVTLTGAPGIGKSRLAIELARQLADGYRDGARLAELAPIGDPARVPAAIASAVAVKEIPGRPLIDTLRESLRRRHLLVVLDNCEHVLRGCRAAVADLIGACPELVIVATSRQPLGIAAEAVWPLAPLSVPAPDEAPSERLLDYDAVRLFVERAGAVQPGFTFNAYVASSIAEIARCLDGVPLAIELAAARVGSFTPAEIANRLEDRFALLRSGIRSDLSAHPTLEASLDWSHELLSPAEQALLRRLSVFRGGFRAGAADVVCGGDGVDVGELRGLLAALVDRSLLVVEDEIGRYRLLETIRAYAAERLEDAGETSRLREAHAGFCLSLAETAEPELTGPDQVRWIARLEDERENLRAALEWSLSHGRVAWGMRLAGALVLYWRVRCHFSDGRELLEASVSAGAGEEPQLRAKALWGAGFMALMSGVPADALVHSEQSLALARELGDASGCARALLILGNCRQYRDDPQALALLDESATMAREAGDSWCLAHALGLAAYEQSWCGELPAARRLFEECLAVSRRTRDTQSLRLGLLGLGVVALHQGDYAAAEPLLGEGLVATEQLREDFGSASARLYLGELAFCRGQYERARTLVDEALALIPEVGPMELRLRTQLLRARLAHALGERARARELFEAVIAPCRPIPGLGTRACIWLGELAADEGEPASARPLFEEALALARAGGNRMTIAGALCALGDVARAEGRAKRAAALHDEALQLRHQLGEKPGVVVSLEAVAGLAVADGRHRHAAVLFGAAGALRRDRGYVRPPWERPRHEADLALVRGGLADAELSSARAEGARMSLDDAVARAARGGGRGGRGASGWSSLTESERRVAALVADGLSNPEIAEQLVVSRETVKTHLANIFAKLGVTSRRELAQEPGARGAAAFGPARAEYRSAG